MGLMSNEPSGQECFQDSKQTFEIGPIRLMEPSAWNGDLDLNGAIDCETPSARTNCSFNSTLVRPLASRFQQSRHEFRAEQNDWDSEAKRVF